MTKAVDSIFSGMSEVHRGLIALVAVGMVMLTFGFALGSMGLREDVAALQRMDERLTNDIAATRANAERNATDISSLRSMIDQAGLPEMAERIRRIDRDLCLLRADRGGAVSDEMQQECARR